MFLKHFRLGFATNSSSTHSIIIVPRLSRAVQNIQDHLPYGDFGWENFVCASPEAKLKYLASTMYENMRELPFWMTHELIKSVTGLSIEQNGYYVDHQSRISLPVSWNEKGLDGEFLTDLKKFLLNDDVIVSGGNDNCQEDSSCFGGTTHNGLSKMCEGPTYVCRKEGDDWVLFDRANGTKVVFSFTDQERIRERPSAPELIDVKITNFCPYECSYCYQASTAQGKHAAIPYDFIDYCETHKVFEVALGGGEPTYHPDFVGILENFRDKGIVPNFSTRNLAWLRDEEMRPRILKACGAFAVSVDTDRQVSDLAMYCQKYLDYCDNGYQATIHHVVGVTKTSWEFEHILRECFENNLLVTLLGWKLAGRGSKVPQHDLNWRSSWLEVIHSLAEKNECPRIGIDTTLAKNYEKEIKALGIPDWLFYVEEGQYSMYYDAVEDIYGPSSFCDEAEYIKAESPEQAWELIGKMQNGKSRKGKHRKA